MFRHLFLMIGCAWLCVAAAVAQVQEISPQKAPETLEAQVAQADVVLLGVVQSAAPVSPRDSMDRQPVREPYEAVVRVEELYKGAAGAQTVTVAFTRAHKDTRPPLMTLEPGDRAVLFLKAPRGGQDLEFVSPFYGRREPDYNLLRDLRAMSTEHGLVAAVEITLTLDAAVARRGAAAPATVRISNKGSVPVVFGSTPAPGQVFTAAGPDGRGLPLRTGARDQAAARIPLYLPAQGVFEYRADLAQLFDLSSPGTITVQAVFSPPSAGASSWQGTLRSQAAALTIE